jgi:hypothetical protein
VARLTSTRSPLRLLSHSLTDEISPGPHRVRFIPHNFKDSTGDTFGAVGSAITLKKFEAHKGKFTGTLLVQADRGFSVCVPSPLPSILRSSNPQSLSSNKTIDYQARHHCVDCKLTPYYGTANLDWAEAQKTLKLSYKKTILYSGPVAKVPATGLDPLAVKPASRKFPELPIAATDYQHVSVAAEGIVLNKDGSCVAPSF